MLGALAGRFLGSWIGMGVMVALVAAAIGGFFVWKSGIERAAARAERSLWEQKVEEAEDKRNAERAAAAQEQTRLADALLKTEAEKQIAEQEKDDALARALATADMSVCRVIPDSILQPFR